MSRPGFANNMNNYTEDRRYARIFQSMVNYDNDMVVRH